MPEKNSQPIKEDKPEIGAPNYEFDLNLEETFKLMVSPDYKERFIAEYAQTKIRYEHLKYLLTRWEAFNEREAHMDPDAKVFSYQQELRTWLGFTPTCPYSLLRNQASQMGDLLHTLELRAAIEGIDLRLIRIRL